MPDHGVRPESRLDLDVEPVEPPLARGFTAGSFDRAYAARVVLSRQAVPCRSIAHITRTR